MKLIIDIADDQYKAVQDGMWCGSLYEELKNGIPVEQCGDCISRQLVLKQTYNWSKDEFLRVTNPFDYLRKRINSLPSVTPQSKVGQWIYDKNIDNWRCSKCGETPKTMGYCGSVAFMAEHFKYCNHCGCKMQEVEE